MSRNIKYTCGQIMPSGCVLFTGEFPAFIPENSVPCNVMLDEILLLHGAEIDTINDSINLTGLNAGCFTFNPATVKVKDFAQETVTKVCALETAVVNLQTTINELNIAEHLIEIDLQCLTPEAAPCLQGANTYSLIAILNVLVSEICLIKSQLNP